MTRYNELQGDPQEYNVQTGESGSETAENVPIPGDDDTPGTTYTLDSTDCDWDDDALWFDCPHCGDRLCAAWFYAADTACNNCGASVTVTITVEQ